MLKIEDDVRREAQSLLSVLDKKIAELNDTLRCLSNMGVEVRLDVSMDYRIGDKVHTPMLIVYSANAVFDLMAG